MTGMLAPRRRQRTGGLIVVALLAALTMSPSTAAATQDEVSERIAWLATGDSYSSGTGLWSAEGDCLRSPHAYAPLARDRAGSAGRQVAPWAFAACHGALSSHFFNRSEGGGQSLWEEASEQLQGNGTDGSPLDVVTFTFGGNDIGFADVVKDCHRFTPGGVLDRLWRGIIGIDPGQGCKVGESELALRIASLADPSLLDERCDPDGEAAQSTDPLIVKSRLNLCSSRERLPEQRQGSLSAFYEAVYDRHVREGGTLVVVGYPRLHADPDTWPDDLGGLCFGLAAEDARMLSRMAELLDQTVGAQVQLAAANNRDIRYLSVQSEFEGHELCGPDERWLNGLTFIGESGRNASFHPNPPGHEATSRLLADLLNELPWSDTPRSTPEPQADDHCDPSMRDEINVWLVGRPDEPPPEATVPAAFADLLETNCVTPQVQSLAASDFESTFTRSEASGQTPEIVAGHNFLPFQGIAATVYQRPEERPRLLPVNSAFDELVDFSGFVFIVPTANRFQVVLDLATRPRCRTTNRSSPPSEPAASTLALEATRDYLAANYMAMSSYLAPQSLLHGASENYIAESGDPARVRALEICSESGAGDIRLFSLSAGYDRDLDAAHRFWSIGQANVVVLLLATGSEWKVVLVTSDPVTAGAGAERLRRALAEVEPNTARGDLRVDLVSPADGLFPNAPPGERFGRFEWVTVGDHSEILVEFAEFAFRGSESRLVTAERDATTSHVSSGRLWHTGGIVRWRAFVLLRNGEILPSETRQFVDSRSG